MRPARRSSPTGGVPGVGAAGSEIQPYRTRAGGGCGRLGDPALRGGWRLGALGLGARMNLKRLTGESGWQNPTTGWLAYPDRHSLSGVGCAPEDFLPHISNAKSR